MKEIIRHRGNGFRCALAALALAGAFALWPQAGQATVTTNYDNVNKILTITSDAADAIAISVVGGNTKVNGADPTGGPAPASTLKGTTVTCVGAFANNINLSTMTVANGFVKANLDGRIFIYAGDGNDTVAVIGSDFNDTIDGGAGNDNIDGGPGDDTIIGGAGADKILCLADGDNITGGNGNDTYDIALPASGVTVTIANDSQGTDYLYFDALPKTSRDVNHNTGARTITIPGGGYGSVAYGTGIEYVFIRPDSRMGGPGGSTLLVDVFSSNVVITGVGGNVKVNGLDPDGGTTSTASVTSITVTATDFWAAPAGYTYGAVYMVNTIDLQGVTSAAGFPSTMKTAVFAAGGADDIYDSQFDDHFRGEGGNDTYFSASGADILEDNTGGNTEQYNVKARPFGTDVTIIDPGHVATPADRLNFDVAPLSLADVTSSPLGGVLTPSGMGNVNYSGIYNIDIRPNVVMGTGAGASTMTVSLLSGNAIFSVVGGDVLVNGLHTDVGPGSRVNTPTSAVKEIVFTISNNAFYNLDNTIDMSSVTAANGFSGMKQPILLNTQGGNDVVTGSGFNDSITMAAGNDTLYMSDGADSYVGGNDNDTFYMHPPAADVTVTVNGGGQTDTIDYDAQGNAVKLTSTGGTAGTYEGPAVGTVTYTTVENALLRNSASVPVLVYTLLTNDAGRLLFTPAIPGGAPGWGRVIVTNAGTTTTADLEITSISIINDPSGYFSFADAAVATTQIVTVTSGTRPSLDIDLNFSAPAPVAETSAALRLVSNDLGLIDVETSIILRAATVTDQAWTAAVDSDWNVAGNWDPATSPTSPFARLLVDGRTATPAIKSDANLVLGSPNPPFLNVSGGEVRTAAGRNLTIQNKGEIHQTGGKIESGGTIAVSSNADAICSMTIEGVSVTSAATALNVGSAANSRDATLNVLGGTITAGTALNVANSAFSRGTANILGGTITLGTQMVMGLNPNSTGTVNFSGGALSAHNVNVGGQAFGTLNMSGGDITLGLTGGTGNMVFGSNADFGTGRGILNMTGGTVHANTFTTGPAGGTIIGWNWTGGDIYTGGFVFPFVVTNGGGTLHVGTTTSSVTVFSDATPYVQTTGAVEFEVTSASVAEAIWTSSALSLEGGRIKAVLVGGEPAHGGSWNIVQTFDGGQINVTTGLDLELPGPNWNITSNATVMTLRFQKDPTLEAPTTVTLPQIIMAAGMTSSSRTFTIGNAGDSDLIVTSMSVVTPTTFTLLEPTTFPLTLTAYDTVTSSTLVTVAFEIPTTDTATYYGTLETVSNDPRTTVDVGLKVEVLAEYKSASTVETWTRY